MTNQDHPGQGERPLPPHPKLERYYQSEQERPAVVGGLFDASAKYYDRITWLMSLGSDRAYRRRVLLQSGLAPGMSLIDVACGTGMVAAPAREIVGPEGRVVGVDPSSGMLNEARKQGRLGWAVLGKAEDLPLADDCFDVLSMGFALRHVADLGATFKECLRVLKPGGTMVIIEIGRPSSQLSYNFLKFYLKCVVPGITRLTTFSRDAQSLMDYHWDTIDRCIPPEAIMVAMEGVGFAQVDRKVTLGLFNEYRAKKPLAG
jgi:demethylmenaquinone methyltransferase/2-methoxy-6-polyprenyl-1,4-benzoquinol methylase